MKNAKKWFAVAALLLTAAGAAACQGRDTRPFAAEQKAGGRAADGTQAPRSASRAAGKPYDLARCLYTAADSQRVERLLAGQAKGNDVLHYARRFTGVPYVASTLEVADPEKLVVNLRGLDCTTLVENALALAMTKRQGRTDFPSFCRNLERLRYRGGRMNGYLSRLHYFTWWFHDKVERGVVSEVRLPSRLAAPIVVDNHYMSRHPEKYKMLRRHPEWTDSIAAMERAANGPDGAFLPQEATRLTRRQLPCVEDGDLIAIVTTKDGLDYSHLGFAVWGADGRLHLLNASSIHHKVVEEPKTLHRYLTEHPSSIGIRVFRLN